MEVVTIADVNKPHIPIPATLKPETGAVIEGISSLGQSVCVLSRPQGD